jgi:methenyltetrahydrofolate cyclohydrolase
VSAPRRLVDLSVLEFVEAVASADQPVPAGGSVAALTGATSAALLVLVCSVIRRKQPQLLGDELSNAERLQQQLLVLIDDDAEAFHAFLHARRRNADLREPLARTSAAPLAIARACLELIDLSQTVEVQISGPMTADVRAARLLAAASLRTVLDIADQKLELVQDADDRQVLREQISRLRAPRDR